MSSETETGDRKAAARAAIAAQLTGRTNRLFYFVVLAVALVGSSTAAQSWLIGDKGTAATHWWHLPAALVAVAVYELGAVAVSRFADQRRQLGERAGVARVASASLAGGAITAQYLGHADTGPAVFFAGVSATGYVIYLLEAAANRRDALRQALKLADTPPAYGLGQWLRHPGITRRARALFLANAEARLTDQSLTPLGRVSSLNAAADQVRDEKRLAAIEDALRARIAAGVDETMAKIAVNTYSLPRVAEGIAAAADYPALTRIITSELVPARLVKLDNDQAAGTAPVSTAKAPAETGTETRTAPVPPAETVRPPAALEVVPAGVATLRLVPLTAPVPPITEPETAPVPAAPTPPAVPAATETAPPPATTGKATDQGGTDETDTETAETAGPDVLADVAAKLVPHMCKVIEAYEDWAVAVRMPPRHPDALSVGKIMAAAGIGGKQLGVDIRNALLPLAEDPETAERAIRSRGLAATAAN
jgi:hypothetical protein